MSDRPKGHGYAAFTRDELEDAKRGRPAAALEGYARERGLEFHGRKMLAGFRRALPDFEEYQHNLMRGVLPGGRWGVLYHELLQTHSTMPDMLGSFYRVNTSSGGRSVLDSFKPRRTNIPVIGWFLNEPGRGDPSEAFGEAFGGPGAWAPVTTVGTPVPETVAPLRSLVVSRKSRVALFSANPNREAGDDWRAYFDERTDQGLLDRLFAGPAAEVLEALALPYAELRVDYGMLTVRRNGYLLDPDALDELARATCLFADTLRDVCLTGDPWSSFDDPLPPCPWADEDRGIDELGIAGAWSKDFRDFAARHDLVLEDPAAWHELFPTQPVPGRVVAAMRGQLDDTGLTGRLLFTTDLLIPTTRAVRGAIAVPAARSADETPPGGIRPDGAGMTCNVRDGIATVWTHRHYGYCSEAEGLAAGAVAAGRAAGTLR